MKQMGIYPARKMVFIKAGLRVWSRWGFFRREMVVFIKGGVRDWSTEKMRRCKQRHHRMKAPIR